MSDIPLIPTTASTTQPSEFGKEEWEKWIIDGPLDALVPYSPHAGSPPPLQFVSGSLGSTSPSELESLPPCHFSPTYALPSTEARKRKSSAITGGNSGSGRQPRGKKISHNVIEKRYRSNLNDKIAKLRDSVPELRSAQPTVKRRPQKPAPSDTEGSGDESTNQGLKFNKATVLTKATEYIQQLERQNQKLQVELSTFRKRSGPNTSVTPTPFTNGGFSTSTVFAQPVLTKPSISITTESSQDCTKPKEEISPSGLIQVPDDIRRLREEVPPQPHYAPEATASGTDATAVIPPFSEVKGMIPLSESWQRFRAQGRSEEHYAPLSSSMSRSPDLQEPNFDDNDEGSRLSRSRFMSRVLVGTLAGLMVMEGFSEREEDTQELNKRGLFALPKDLLTESRGFREPIRKRIIAFSASPKARQFLPMLSFSFVFFAVCFVIFLYLVPVGSKAVRDGPVEEKCPADGQGSSTLTSTSSPIASTAADSIIVVEHTEQSSTSMDLLAQKVLQWFGFASQRHDEEAASRSDSLDRPERWTKFLPTRFLDNIQTT